MNYAPSKALRCVAVFWWYAYQSRALEGILDTRAPPTLHTTTEPEASGTGTLGRTWYNTAQCIKRKNHLPLSRHYILRTAR
jgi:hypothetical protein